MGIGFVCVQESNIQTMTEWEEWALEAWLLSLCVWAVLGRERQWMSVCHFKREDEETARENSLPDKLERT